MHALKRKILLALYEKHVKQCEEKGAYDNKRVHERSCLYMT